MDRINLNTSSLSYRGNRIDRDEQENKAVPQSSLPETDQRRPPTMAMRNPRPAWLRQQIQEGLRQGGNLARRVAHGVGGIVQNPATPKILATAGIGQIIGSVVSVALNNNAARGRQWQQAEAYANMAHFLANGGQLALLMALGTLITQFINLRQPGLAGVPLDVVVAKFRAHQTGSSSEVTSSFNWKHPGLFVNDQGEDVTGEISHWLNRIHHAIQNSSQEEAARMWPAANMLLGKLEIEPTLRNALANQIKIIDENGTDVGLNAACIDRTAVGFNTLVRELCKEYDVNMDDKDFLLRAIHQMVILKADKKISDFMEEKGKMSNVHTYQTVQSSVMKELRQKIPALAQDGIENLNQDSRLDIFDLDQLESGLKKSERKTIVKEIVEQFDTPKKIALLLLSSRKENAFMEDRYKNDITAITEKIQEEGDQATNLNTPEDEYSCIYARLGEKRTELINQLYESIVTDAGIFKSMA